jgi:uncharacterized protein (TIGR00299 family) protein
MKVLYYDCFCGISGDMNLGALVDLGVDEEYLIKELAKLQLDSEYEIRIAKAQKMGITGTKVDVLLNTEAHRQDEMVGHHGVDHAHVADEHQPEHQHGPQPERRHHHQHRNLHDIETIINNSGLNERVKASSLEMFRRIAQAEAKVHGKAINEVHFHEVGAVDSIVDMVGAAIGLDYLKVDRILASPVSVGGGFVKCAHGIFPVPAPATVELLAGIPLKTGLVPFETTTPTGAAILAANVGQFTDRIEFTIVRTGYGIGNRDLEIPNVLRVYLGETADCEEVTEQYLLETNIDDMNPELYSYVEERLLALGALDVFKTPIIMKKGRPAVKLSVLVDQVLEPAAREVIFRETTSLGVREFRVKKMMLPREFATVVTEFGPITVKTAYYEGEAVKYKPEYEDCRKAAGEHGVTLARVYQAVERVMQQPI